MIPQKHNNAPLYVTNKNLHHATAWLAELLQKDFNMIMPTSSIISHLAPLASSLDKMVNAAVWP